MVRGYQNSPQIAKAQSRSAQLWLQRDTQAHPRPGRVRPSGPWALVPAAGETD